MKVLMLLIRFNQIGYIYEKDSTKRKCNYLLPLGLAYLSAVLKKEGFNISCYNLNHHNGHVRDLVRRELTRVKYDVVFLGGLSLYYPHVRDTMSYVREVSPETKIVVGGGLITSQPEIMFNLLKPDYGIIGEGEITATELMRCIEKCIDPSDVPGLIYQKNEKVIVTAPRTQVDNLDVLPFPDYDGFGFGEYLEHIRPDDYIAYDVVDNPRFYPVLASRNCPFNCTFCFHPLGHKYRQRSVDNIMEEIRQAVIKYRINIIFSYDELFSHDKKRVLEFCDKFKAFSDTLPWKLWFYTSMRVDSTDNEMVKKIKESGGYLLSFGLESYSKTILDSMKKHTTPEQILNVFRIIRDNKMGIQGSFIFGDVAETMETAKETLDFFNNNQDLIRGGVQTGFIVPFQGSPIYQHCIANGRIKDEIAFIEGRALEGYQYNEPMNLTDTLSDTGFEQLKNDVLLAQVTSWRYVFPEYTNDNEVHIRCPFCNEVSVIKNITAPKYFKYQGIGCRHCFARFYMVSHWYLLEKFILKTVGFNRMHRVKKMWMKLWKGGKP